MLITLLPQNRIGNYAAPNPVNYRDGCARARSSFKETTPNDSACACHSKMQIDKNFRHGDGGNRSPPRLSWFLPIRAQCHIDGDDDEDDGRGGVHDDAGHRRVAHHCEATVCRTKHFDTRSLQSAAIRPKSLQSAAKRHEVNAQRTKDGPRLMQNAHVLENEFIL